MKKYLLVISYLLLLALVPHVQGQPGLYIPSEKPIKPKELAKAWVNPPLFCLVLQFDAGDSNYRERDLDLLDSTYRIAFSLENPQLYTLSIEGYAQQSDSALMAARVESVYRYFAMRGEEPFPVRFAYNPIHCSCHGDTMELLRYEVPTDRQVYRCDQLPDSRKLLNGQIRLEDCVLITFRHNPAECIGTTEGCFIPAQDSNIRAYYTQLLLPKGSVYSVKGTRGECPPPVSITIDEHLDYKQVVDNYALVPHRRQIILPVGYVVLHSTFVRQHGECAETLPDSIFIRFPVTEEQVESKLRIFAKKYSDKGPEYKSLPTKKIKNGPVLMIQAAINPMQFDTIYLGKRIQAEEVRSYLYPADSPTEQGAITILGRGGESYYKPFKVGRDGTYEFKKPFRAMLRIIEGDLDENDNDNENPAPTDGDEEL